MIHKGEATAIVVAKQVIGVTAVLVTDDGTARKAALDEGVTVTCTPQLIVGAVRAEWITLEAGWQGNESINSNPDRHLIEVSKIRALGEFKKLAGL